MYKKYLLQLKQCFLLLAFQKKVLQYFENKHERKCFSEKLVGEYQQQLSCRRHCLFCTRIFLSLELVFVSVEWDCLPKNVQKNINWTDQLHEHICILNTVSLYYSVTRGINLYQEN